MKTLKGAQKYSPDGDVPGKHSRNFVTNIPVKQHLKEIDFGNGAKIGKAFLKIKFKERKRGSSQNVERGLDVPVMFNRFSRALKTMTPHSSPLVRLVIYEIL